MKNKVIIKGDIAEIHIRSKVHGNQIVLIDVVDLPLLDNVTSIFVGNNRNKSGHRDFLYAWVRFDGKALQLHRFLMLKAGYEIEGKIIDHIHHNRLDNRRSYNLRIADKYLNSHNRNGLDSHNTSGVRGVYFDNYHNKWVVELHVHGKRKRFGRYKSFDVAALVAKEKLQEITELYTG